MNLDQLLPIITSNIFNGIFVGLGIGVALWLIGKRFVRELEKYMPIWIDKITLEIQKNNTLHKVEEIRRKHS